MKIRSIINCQNLSGKNILLRADFDVEMEMGTIKDDYRIRACLPSIKFLLSKKAHIRIIAHLGRPEGKFQKKLTLQPIAEDLEKRLKRKVTLIKDPFNKKNLDRYFLSEEVILFENIRFWDGEENNDKNFAKKLAAWGELYVNEAFADSHRKHASIFNLARLLPSMAGLNLEKEISSLGQVIRRPAKPFLLILGGAKISTKIPLIHRFLHSANFIFIGGALANTFWLNQNISIGNSYAEKGKILGLDLSITKHKNIILPLDALIASSLTAEAKVSNAEIGSMPADYYIADAGKKTISYLKDAIKKSKMIVWNGPLGFAEIKKFSKGTLETARAISKSASFSVVGGGDTIGILERNHLLKGFSHVSTGGGAMLEFLSGKKLPGIEALKSYKEKSKK